MRTAIPTKGNAAIVLRINTPTNNEGPGAGQPARLA